ncbi:PREDICTED: trans-resveratrol [Prunus dulcis]|uniref:PREDICTED: trans-resveratrol n=1 Tax=Prunus dulcis TaxID=3755 RepID=A0A5E4FL15_PRUDU|nr:PREDICTED: trans-resveratrol [Prunus dulcis]
MSLNNDKVSATSHELLQAQAHVWNHIFQFINSMSLKCAVQLGIPDVIHNHGQPISLSNLISGLNVHPSKAYFIARLMRILVHSNFFAQDQQVQLPLLPNNNNNNENIVHQVQLPLLPNNNNNNENIVHQDLDDEAEEKAVVVYSLTPASRLLLKEAPLSTTQFLLMILDPVVTDPFHLMGTWCQMNNHGNHDHPASPFEMAHGRPFWGLAAQQPKFGSLFNEAMEADSQLIARAVVEECEGVFEGLNSLVDVGGGTGNMAKAIAKAFPNINCTVLDQPHVVANLQGTHNLDFVGGDMFEKIPPANAIFLKWILHDWSDEESVKILKKSREAILSKNEGGKVIILDINVSADNTKMDKKSIETQLMWDMLMMVDLSGKERSEAEWEKLFLTAGFSHYKITHTLGLRSLIEVYP